MITKDFEISKNIFNLLNSGIIGGYDSFSFEIYTYTGYMVRTLHVTLDSLTIDNAKTDFNSAILCEMVKEFQKNAHERGDKWCGFVMSYEQGGEVKVNFKYVLPDE